MNGPATISGQPHPRRCGAAAVALIGWLLTVLPAQGLASTGERLDDLLNGFVEAAFRGDDGRPVALRRWEGPLRLRLVDEESKFGRRVVEQLRRLADIAGLAVEVLPADGNTPENLLIVIEGGAGYRVNGRDAGCYTRVRFDAEGALTHAEIRINNRHAGRNGACAAHELMHGLGFPGHPQRLRSVLNATEGIVMPTEDDAILLKLLYAPELELGQSESVTTARIRDLLARHLEASAERPAGAGR